MTFQGNGFKTQSFRFADQRSRTGGWRP